MTKKAAIRARRATAAEAPRSGIRFELHGFDALIAELREAVRLDLEEARAQEGGAA